MFTSLHKLPKDSKDYIDFMLIPHKGTQIGQRFQIEHEFE